MSFAKTVEKNIVALLLLLSLGCAGGRYMKLVGPSKLNKARALSHLQKATEYLLENPDHAKAEKELALSLEMNPGDIRALFWAAWTDMSLLKRQEAFERFVSAAGLLQPASELAIWSAYNSIDGRPQARKLKSVLRAIVDNPKTPPLIRARATHFLGQVLRYLGQFDQSSEVFSTLGYVRQWMVVGPFDNDQNSGFDKEYGPETEPIDLKKKYKGKQRDVSWKKVNHFSFDSRVSLRAIMDPSRWTTAYLVTWIHSKASQDVAFRLAAFRGVKLWLNGRLLLSDDQARLPALDQYNAGATVQKGWNLLLVKVCQRKGPWQLGLRITDLDGNKVPGLRFDTDFHPTPKFQAGSIPANDPVSAPQPKTLLSHLDNRHDPWSDAVRIQWLTKLGFYTKAIGEAEEWALKNPGSALAQELLEQVYFFEGRDSKAVKALDKANKLNPGLADIMLSRVRYEQGRRRYARAMKYLRPLLDKMPENPLVRATYIYLLAARGWNFEALLEAEKFANTNPGRSWSWTIVGSELAKINRNIEAENAYKKALSIKADDKDVYDRLISMAINRGDILSAIDLVKKRTKVFPQLLSAALDEAKIYIAANMLPKALEVCARLEKIAPDYWLIHKTRADVLMLLGRRRQAVSAYKKSLECYPDNPDLQEYMDHLDKKKDPVFEKYALDQFLIDSILSSPPRHSQYPEADSVLLLDDQITHVFKDGFARHKVHQIYWIRTQRAQQRLSKFRVPPFSSFRLEVAQTILPDGTRQDATSIRTGVIHLPSLQPGALIDVAYGYTSQSKTWMENHFADSFYFQSKNPVTYSRWVLAIPGSKKLKAKIVGDLATHENQKLGNDNVHIWSAKNVPLIHSDLASPPLRQLAAAVYVSTIPDWDTVARWEASLIQDQFDTDEAIRRKTAELIAEKTTKMKKMEALYGFVVQKVRYLYHDVGIFGKKPNQAANVFANMYGDCKDKSTLLIAMLRYAGIDAYYSAIRTRNKGPVFWEVPCAQTNHAITYIPAQPGVEKELFLDPTATFFNMHTLPEQDQGVDALVITKNGYKIVRTPVQTEKSNLFKYDLKLSVDAVHPNEPCSLQGAATWTGWAAANHRQVFRAEGKRMERFSNELAYLYPGAIVKKVDFSGLEGLGKTSKAVFSALVPGLVRAEGSSVRVSALWQSKALQYYSQRPSRHYDLFLNFPMNQEVKIVVSVSEGFRVASIPTLEKVQTPVFSYSTGCWREKDRIICSRKITWHERRLKKADYPLFRTSCTKIKTLESRDIVFTKD